MTRNVYQIWSAGSSVALTVFARNAKGAELIYRKWRSVYYPAWSKDPARLVEVSKEWLAERRQLAAEALEGAKAGQDLIFYFLGHDAGWTGRPVYMDPVGVIAPLEPIVQYYVVETADDGDFTEVFAYSYADACQTYIDHYESAYTKCAHKFLVAERSRWLLADDKITLRKEMDRGIVGIAGWDMKEGWHIYPFDHEMAGE